MKLNQTIARLIIPMVRGHTIVRTPSSLLTIPPLPFQNRARYGAFEIDFYRRQAKYILWNKSQTNRTFKWEHPFRIVEDEQGIVWYYNKQCDMYWRPTTSTGDDTISWLYRESSVDRSEVHLVHGTLPYPTFTFTDSECRL